MGPNLFLSLLPTILNASFGATHHSKLTQSHLALRTCDRLYHPRVAWTNQPQQGMIQVVSRHPTRNEYAMLAVTREVKVQKTDGVAAGQKMQLSERANANRGLQARE